MKNKTIHFSLPLILGLILSPSLYAQTSNAELDAVKNKLAKNYPKVELKSLQQTEMQGLYSATLDDQVVYVNAQAEHLFIGSMIRLKDQKNLTKALVQSNSDMQSNTKLQSSTTVPSDQKFDIQQLPLQDAIKTVKGQGQRSLVIFSDPLCPYCQQLEKNLNRLNNITIYTFIVPLKNQSMSLSTKIWCAPSRSYAWQQWMNKQVQPSNTTSCETPLQANLQLAKKMGLTGTPMLVFANGRSVHGAYSTAEIESFLQQQ